MLTPDQAEFLRVFRYAIEMATEFDHETSRNEKDEVVAVLMRAHGITQTKDFKFPRIALTELPDEYLGVTGGLLLSVMVQILSK